jgi:hypothetical protein
VVWEDVIVKTIIVQIRSRWSVIFSYRESWNGSLQWFADSIVGCGFNIVLLDALRSLKAEKLGHRQIIRGA